MERYEPVKVPKLLIFTVVLLFVSVAVSGVSLVGWLLKPKSVPEARQVSPRGELAEFEKTTVELFRLNSPSVVFISTKTRVSNPYTRRVFDVEKGTGSGFVWDKQGHIVTNFHVLRGASSAKIIFDDQSSYDATLVGTSANHDLAVLKIDASAASLRPVLIGESNDLKVGQSVFAIGNPFGLSHTLTTGVVSAKSRVIRSPSGEQIDDVIQIDAAINPGNSGGPLLDSAGRLIGVNTALFSETGNSAGIGFSIPVDTVNRVVPQLITSGRYRPPRIGIESHEELSRSITARLQVGGVVVLGVQPYSPAEKAGIQSSKANRSGGIVVGDIIQKVDGGVVNRYNEFLDLLEKKTRGDKIKLTIWRDRSTIEVEVVLE